MDSRKSSRKKENKGFSTEKRNYDEESSEEYNSSDEDMSDENEDEIDLDVGQYSFANQKKEKEKEEKRIKNKEKKKKEKKKINKKKLEATKPNQTIEQFLLSSSNRKAKINDEKKNDDKEIDFLGDYDQNSSNSSNTQIKKVSPKKKRTNLTFNKNSASTFKKFVEDSALIEKELSSKYNILPSEISDSSNNNGDKDDNDEKMEDIEENKNDDQNKMELEEEVVDQEDWFTIANELENPGEMTINKSQDMDPTKLLEEDGSLKFYFLDAYEGIRELYLIGKVERDNEYHSCCISLTDLKHRVFLSPCEDLEIDDTEKDLIDLMQNKYGMKDFQFKQTEKTYHFDDPSIKKGTSTFWEVIYPVKHGRLNESKIPSKIFSKVIGNQVSLLEDFLLNKKIMGPSWLSLDGVKVVPKKQKKSWCAFELYASAGDVEIMSGKKDSPTLTVLSLNVKTQFVQSLQINEIVCISGMISKDVNIDSVQSLNKMNKEFRSFSVIRKLSNTIFPDQVKKMADRNNKKIEFVDDEKGLLNYFIAKIHLIDPDVIVGHNLLGFDLDVLLHRMQKLRISNWSKIGRLERIDFPRLQRGAGGTGNSDQDERSVFAGRLPCDTFVNTKELVRLKNYTLGFLADSQLSIKRYDLGDEPEPHYSSAPNLLKYIEHAENDCYIALCLLYKLEMLPLTKQLTNLAGNVWSSTLQGGRALRIEYLLLHEFHNRHYILPEKKVQKYNNAEKKKKAPAYKGGLVLDPQVGFYDKMVILLDFNSLYPSIIQEYNICFTTVTRTRDSDNDKWLPSSVPDPTVERGVLPQVLKTLVDRRRQVRSEAEKTKDPEKLQQLDVKQKAFKLTANSLYGCLGFKNSRFYAMPLAELITRCGRETLQKTVNIANNNLHLRVIYGDTDSIMIYTGSNEIEDAIKVGKSVIKEVNVQYKTLEIAIDGIYKSMLLLSKKKYATSTLSKVNNKGSKEEWRTSIESKGLDLVRRDWCDLSKKMGTFILDQILSGKPLEESLEIIKDYLKQQGEKIRNGQIALKDFIITRGLNKDPKSYSDTQKLPHVQVALKMLERNERVVAGTHIPYVICQGDSSVSERAFHPDHLLKSNNEIKLDFEWYINQQIFPPVSRLLAPIESFSPEEIANLLGLKFNKPNNATVNRDFSEFDKFNSFNVDPIDRYRNCAPLNFVCSCNHKFVINGVLRKIDNTNSSTVVVENENNDPNANQDSFSFVSALSCPSCNKKFTRAFFLNKIDSELRKFLDKFASFTLMCTDDSCSFRSNHVFLKKKPSCHCKSETGRLCGKEMKLIMDSYQLLQQIYYINFLFTPEDSIDATIRKNFPNISEEIKNQKINELTNLFDPNDLSLFKEIRAKISKLSEKNGRAMVDLGSIFNFYKKFEVK